MGCGALPPGAAVRPALSRQHRPDSAASDAAPRPAPRGGRARGSVTQRSPETASRASATKNTNDRRVGEGSGEIKVPEQHTLRQSGARGSARRAAALSARPGSGTALRSRRARPELRGIGSIRTAAPGCDARQVTQPRFARSLGSGRLRSFRIGRERLCRAASAPLESEPGAPGRPSRGLSPRPSSPRSRPSRSPLPWLRRGSRNQPEEPQLRPPRSVTHAEGHGALLPPRLRPPRSPLPAAAATAGGRRARLAVLP